MQSRKLSEQGTDTLCINICIICDCNNFMSDRIESAKDMKAFSPRWRSHKEATKRP